MKSTQHFFSILWYNEAWHCELWFNSIFNFKMVKIQSGQDNKNIKLINLQKYIQSGKKNPLRL